MKYLYGVFSLLLILNSSCVEAPLSQAPSTHQISNILNYQVSPKSEFDKSGLMFSDQGAWFAYSFPDSAAYYGGFSGPFLMTEQNGIWSSPSLSQLIISDAENKPIDWKDHTTTSYNSHLEQTVSSDKLKLEQTLVFSSGHSAIIKYTLINISEEPLHLNIFWRNEKLLNDSLELSILGNELVISSNNTDAIGHFQFPQGTELIVSENDYKSETEQLILKSNRSKELTISQTFIFPEYSWEKEKMLLKENSFDKILSSRIKEKEVQLQSLFKQLRSYFNHEKYKELLTKSHLTLQNNWRIPAGEIAHEGLFPSYHYKWFNGFWSWDSWKHAVGLSFYNVDLAKKQMKLMFEFQREDGFIVDCVYRDTSIEAHNFRDTKPPLSSWAVAKIFEKDKDSAFLKEFYPKLKKYHYWWYEQRDHDKDGLCEYGSTDGSLVAAKWESGMDNAIRFDQSKILKNGEGAFSLDQESVDLNAYLYAEKNYLSSLAKILGLEEDENQLVKEAAILKTSIQNQFFDPIDGWFYDTNLEGTQFIKGEGSEGWTALWAMAATQAQAESVIENMLNPNKFYTKVPFQTMSADHPKFDPMNGYWRGPNWLDQSYFGIKSLRNYGYSDQANNATKKLLEGAQGLLGKGTSIRENYHPMTGKGLYAQNFSWSAAHIIMMLMDN